MDTEDVAHEAVLAAAGRDAHAPDPRTGTSPVSCLATGLLFALYGALFFAIGYGYAHFREFRDPADIVFRDLPLAEAVVHDVIRSWNTGEAHRHVSFGTHELEDVVVPRLGFREDVDMQYAWSTGDITRYLLRVRAVEDGEPAVFLFVDVDPDPGAYRNIVEIDEVLRGF